MTPMRRALARRPRGRRLLLAWGVLRGCTMTMEYSSYVGAVPYTRRFLAIEWPPPGPSVTFGRPTNAGAPSGPRPTIRPS
jgi:hypothetical protein